MSKMKKNSAYHSGEISDDPQAHGFEPPMDSIDDLRRWGKDMAESRISVANESQIYEWMKGWREHDSREAWTTEERILRSAARCIHEALLREAETPEETPSQREALESLEEVERVSYRIERDDELRTIRRFIEHAVAQKEDK